jgi:hypothetical protein
MKKFICALLATLACLTLFACTPSNVEKAKAKMEKAGYKVAGYEDEDAEGLVGAFSATKTPVIDTIKAFLFESEKAAKEFAEKTGNLAKQDGKWVFIGSESAIEAFTK